MRTTDRWSGRHGVYYAVAAACLLLVAGLTVLTLGFTDSTDAGPTDASSTDTGAPAITSPSRNADPERPRSSANTSDEQRKRSETRLTASASPPQAITIPRIGVRADEFESLGLARNGEIEVPQDADNPGWYTPGPAPGQIGPAVIAGHLDDETGPAVFARLSELEAGDRVRVTPRRGPVAVFTIDRVVSFDQDDFPTKAVYGPTIRSELRLITCGGRYDGEDGYERNTVVFAHRV